MMPSRGVESYLHSNAVALARLSMRPRGRAPLPSSPALLLSTSRRAASQSPSRAEASASAAPRCPLSSGCAGSWTSRATAGAPTPADLVARAVCRRACRWAVVLSAHFVRVSSAGPQTSWRDARTRRKAVHGSQLGMPSKRTLARCKPAAAVAGSPVAVAGEGAYTTLWAGA